MKYIRRYNESRTITATNETIEEIVLGQIEELGSECDLNHINVSNVSDMKLLFKFSKFNGDISKQDVGNVRDMELMFYKCRFNGDISNWNVGNLEMAYRVFEQSRFNGDISNWDVSNVSNMEMMFNRSPFNGDISNWDVSNVTNMVGLFLKSKFNGDISNWDVSNVSEMAGMFEMSPFNGDLTHWNVKSLIDKAHRQFDNSPLKGKEPWWYCFLRVFYSAELMMDSLDWNWIDLENKIIWRSRLIYTLNKRKNEKWNGKFPKVWGFTYK